MFNMNENKMLQKLISPHFHPPTRPKKAEIMAFIRERHGTLTHFQCFLSIFKPTNCLFLPAVLIIVLSLGMLSGGRGGRWSPAGCSHQVPTHPDT